MKSNVQTYILHQVLSPSVTKGAAAVHRSFHLARQELERIFELVHFRQKMLGWS
jgi:hypothetical protein